MTNSAFKVGCKMQSIDVKAPNTDALKKPIRKSKNILKAISFDAKTVAQPCVIP